MLLAICFRIFWVFFWEFRPVRRRTMAWYFYGYFFGNYALFAVEQWLWYFLFVWYFYGSFALFAVEQWLGIFMGLSPCSP
jgi:hypothetical protein